MNKFITPKDQNVVGERASCSQRTNIFSYIFHNVSDRSTPIGGRLKDSISVVQKASLTQFICFSLCPQMPRKYPQLKMFKNAIRHNLNAEFWARVDGSAKQLRSLALKLAADNHFN